MMRWWRILPSEKATTKITKVTKTLNIFVFFEAFVVAF